MPSRLAVRMIRRATSPRLAMSSDSIMEVFLSAEAYGSGASAAGQGVERRVPQQRGPAATVDLAAQERGGVHQAERRVRQHPGLGRIELGAQRTQHADPLLHVEALQAADLPARLLGEAVELVQVQGD